MLKFGDWINRKRHNRGYGVQSPSAFFFVTQVLRERLPYYAYTTLDRAVGGNRAKRKHFRELFRITNHLQPTSCISVGSAGAACAMAASRPSVPHYAIAPSAMNAEAKELLTAGGCHIIESVEQLPAIIGHTGGIGMLYINATDEAYGLIKAVLPYTNKNSVIIVDGLNRSKATKEWWQQLIGDKTTVITYDMHSYGLLFFDKERIKQHYTLKR